MCAENIFDCVFSTHEWLEHKLLEIEFQFTIYTVQMGNFSKCVASTMFVVKLFVTFYSTP